MARHPLDHDGDGRIGGSVVAKLGDTIIVHRPPANVGDPWPKHAGIVTHVEPGNGPFVVRVLSTDGSEPDFYLNDPITEAEHNALPDTDPAKNLHYWSFYRP